MEVNIFFITPTYRTPNAPWGKYILTYQYFSYGMSLKQKIYYLANNLDYQFIN